MNFISYYKHPKNFRFDSFKFALDEAYKRNHKILVETGVSRGKQKFLFFVKKNWNDGMSTMIFSDYAKFINGHLYTCDINKKNIDNAKKFIKNNKDFVTFIEDDSLNFLKNFENKVDFLYLDSLDGQFINSSEHQLKEIEIAINLLNSNSLVLLDDKGVKTNLSLDFLKKKNYKIINETKEQLLLSL
tara:strand:- start:301 stop:861 length:561 start_codon:yes stop_codon:yes gene_type:complete